MTGFVRMAAVGRQPVPGSIRWMMTGQDRDFPEKLHNGIGGKLRSERGASITFALLLFLVCAVVSATVVAAATAAAGRMSQRAEVDRRYYAVTSAVELLRGELGGKKVTVQYEYAKPRAEGTEVTPTATEIRSSETNTVLASVADPAKPMANYVLCKGLSETLVDAVANPSKDINSLKKGYALTTDVTDAKTALNCTVTAYPQRDGRVILEISNPPKTGGAIVPAYTMQAEFTAVISESVQERQDVDAANNPVTKVTVTTNIEWKLGGMRKGSVK